MNTPHSQKAEIVSGLEGVLVRLLRLADFYGHVVVRYLIVSKGRQRDGLFNVAQERMIKLSGASHAIG